MKGRKLIPAVRICSICLSSLFIAVYSGISRISGSIKDTDIEKHTISESTEAETPEDTLFLTGHLKDEPTHGYTLSDSDCPSQATETAENTCTPSAVTPVSTAPDDCTKTSEPTESDPTVITATPVPVYMDVMIQVYLDEEERIITLPLEDFVVGALAAEMSYDSPREALLAQAVAIRSYVAHKLPASNHRHGDACVCNRSSHCLSYYSHSDMVSRWGEEGTRKITEKLREIAEECLGEVLVYEGETADTLFHDSSRKQTESYADLYRKDIPYLRSVESYEKVAVYTVSLSFDELNERLFKDSSPDYFSPIIGGIERHRDSGRVESITLLGRRFDGNSFRFLLGLSSTDFEVSVENGRIVFTSYGCGHGIGMSQKGAKVLAEGGMGYREILGHYYPGCEMGYAGIWES